MKKICFVVTSEFVVKAFMREHIRSLSQHFEVSLIVNTKNLNLLKDMNLDATLIPMNIKREINPIYDLFCLFMLIQLFLRNRYDAVHSLTPKAGLLTILAGWITLRPIRVHTFQGEVWVTKKGLLRWFLIGMDKLVATLSTHLTVVSNSEKNFLLKHKIINEQKAIVFHKGSISGVDLNRFFPDESKRKKIREDFGIKPHDVVLVYVGRLNRDKGLIDLVDVFAEISDSNLYLVIVGPDEHLMAKGIRERLKHKQSMFHLIPETESPEDYMNASDIICLPSYREGFGMVIIEAAACGIPAVASRIYGITDAIEENFTGLMHEAGNVADLKNKLEIIISDSSLRHQLGKNAYKRVVSDFKSNFITDLWLEFYNKLLLKK